MAESSKTPPVKGKTGLLVGNVGKPLKLTELQLAGVSAEAAREGDTVRVWTRMSLTSDDRFFHRIVDSLTGHVGHIAAKSGHAVNLANTSVMLLVIHPDNSGDLWLDTAAISLKILTKRSVEAGSPIFESDIADVVAMTFPLVEVDEKDGIICLFRVGWRFALFFDFNPDGKLSIEDMERDLGTLHRRTKYRDLYDAVADDAVFGRLIEAGWFPFVEILGSEFRQLVDHCEAGFELDEIEPKLLAAFTTQRVENMFVRWMAKPHFAGKERLL